MEFLSEGIGVYIEHVVIVQDPIGEVNPGLLF